MSNRSFNKVKSLSPRSSMFDLSYEKKFSCDMGQLIPVMCDEVVPGDYIKLGCQSIIRFQPLVAPIMHEVNQFVHYFFVPYRILFSDFEEFITGGIDGDDTTVLPTWSPTLNSIGSLWDYLGFPTDVIPAGALPLDFPRLAYNTVYNEYYRDETLQPEVPLTNEAILRRSWEKDYFTSSLPWQQRGTAPALPVSGLVPVTGLGKVETTWISGIPIVVNATGGQDTYQSYQTVGSDTSAPKHFVIEEDPNNPGYPNLRVDLGQGTTFDIADLRLAFQIQKWMERNARSGARYTEFLKSHFGVSPRDERLQRPEYIGGSKSPIIISEVLQTQATTSGLTPQGNLAGHGISVNDSFCGRYSVKEFGLIIGLMSVMPRSSYQQGINRQWLRRTKYDFYFPEFSNLSEQAIENAEICATNDQTHNIGIFGYQGRYDEMRYKPNMVCSMMRDTFDYWHLGRKFDTATPPALNDEFLQCNPRKDIFAVQNEHTLIVQFANIIKAFRPMPIQAEPGLIDHN